MKRGIKMAAGLLGLSVYICGCGANTDMMGAETVQEQIANEGTETLAEEIPTEEMPEEENNEPDYMFDEEFSLAAGESVIIGDGVKFELKSLEFIVDTSVYRVEYTLTKDENEYPGIAFWNQSEGSDFYPDVYNPYEITFVSVKGGIADLTADFQISDVREVPETMTISGNVSDTYTTIDYEYVEGDKCILYLDKDVAFKGNIIEVIEHVMDAVEDETGYEYYVDNKYSAIRTDGIREIEYGLNPWPGVDEFNEKIAVYVVNRPEDAIMSCAFERAIVLAYEDFEVETEGVYAMAHELTHTILMRNGESLNTKLSEGYACCIGGKVAEKFTEYPLSNMASEREYGSFPYQLDGTTAEDIFLTEYDDYAADFKNYQYGVYFITYLLETYGNDGFHNFLDNLNDKNADNYVSPSSEMQMEVLKETFSNEIFKDFGKWYIENSKRFVVDS